MVTAEYESEFTYLSTKSEDFSGITTEITLQENLKAPIQKGELLGEQIYYLGEKKLGSSRILAAEDVEKMAFIDCLKKVWEIYCM